MPRKSNYRSQALSLPKVRVAMAAHDHAKAKSCQLNLTVDIHWQWTRFAKTAIWNCRKAVPALLESLRHWLAYHGIGFFCIAVREAPPSSNEGEHLHLLIHVPPDLRDAFLQHARDFLRGNKRHQKRALAWDTPYSDGKLAYILKGCTPPARELLAAMFETGYERNKFVESTRDKVRQGVIYGKRLLISQAIGPKARRRALREPTGQRQESSASTYLTTGQISRMAQEA
jgi:hypothetical protein